MPKRPKIEGTSTGRVSASALNESNTPKQEATTIDGFHGAENGFLSNFYPSPIKIKGKEYATVEHFFQASKALSEDQHEVIRLSHTPGLAKMRGKILRPRRSDWESVKDGIMLRGLQAKFEEGSELAAKLLSTSDAYLVEGNYWHDNYWGDCHCGKQPACASPGRNQLGQLLMLRRAALKGGA